MFADVWRPKVNVQRPKNKVHAIIVCIYQSRRSRARPVSETKNNNHNVIY